MHLHRTYLSIYPTDTGAEQAEFLFITFKSLLLDISRVLWNCNWVNLQMHLLKVAPTDRIFLLTDCLSSRIYVSMTNGIFGCSSQTSRISSTPSSLRNAVRVSWTPRIPIRQHQFQSNNKFGNVLSKEYYLLKRYVWYEAEGDKVIQWRYFVSYFIDVVQPICTSAKTFFYAMWHLSNPTDSNKPTKTFGI